jgi:major vault protein
MPDNSARERDLVLAPNEFAYISDQTKGNINVYVGPYKTSLANTDQPVVFNDKTKRFERTSLEHAIQVFSTAPEGWYLVVKNPARDGGHPKFGTVSSLPELDIGRKVNIPGPVSFAQWPGQMVRVIQGHNLRSNQYLLVRVYDEEAAKKNWGQAVIKPQKGADGAEVVKGDGDAPDLTMGKLLVIKGTEISFYIPPTGVEVVRVAENRYVREAVTLERLEYCILRDEDGNKRFIQGPAVVFPRPTETFVEKNDSRKYRAIELNELSGLYVKVIAPYRESDRDHKVGEELFITGRHQMIYFPRPEHAIVRYGEQEIHYAVAIPAGEGRYCLNRVTGQISLVRGPAMFLPDPRKEVIVRRILDPGQVALWFPGNQEALQYNVQLKSMARARGPGDYLTDQEATKSAALPAEKKSEEARAGFAGDELNRRTAFTPPRTITLETKYDGAVTISVWTGYAVLVVSRTGQRKVIVGPHTHLLEYDETLESTELSTGTPKTDQKLFKTSYLRVLHNKVSDMVNAETSDLCNVQLHVSYRVNFEGVPERWFDVENYVKFLTDHMRSLLRNAIKQMGIEQFNVHAIDIIRDTVLGRPGEDGKRKGRVFDENGMRIYDVEVLNVTIGDEKIAALLTTAQHTVVNQTLEVAADRRRLEFVRQAEAIKQQVNDAVTRTRQQEMEIKTEEVKKALGLKLVEIQAQYDAQLKTLEARLREQQALTQINDGELARRSATLDLEVATEQRRQDQRLAELKAEVNAVVEKARAVSPELVAALQGFSDRALVEKVAESMAPLAILGGQSVVEVLAKLLKGSPLEKVLSLPAPAPPQVKSK